MGKISEIHFTSVIVEPGQLFQLVSEGTVKAGCVPTDLVIDSSSPNMIINFLRASGRDLLASGSALPAGTLGRTAFTQHPIEKDAEFSLGVTNLSDSPQRFTAVLLLEKAVVKSQTTDPRATVPRATGPRATGPSLADDELHRILEEERIRPEDLNLDDEEPGVLSKCWSWFTQGVAVAVADRTLGAEGHLPLGELVRPARARDSLRRLVSDFVDAAEIPLLAAALYWKQIAELAHGVREQEVAIPSTVGFGPEMIKSGTAGEVMIRVVGRFRPKYLKLAGEISPSIRIVDVRIGKDSVLLSPCPIPGALVSEGVYLGGNQIALSDVVVVIENFTTSDVEVSGILDGEQVSFVYR